MKKTLPFSLDDLFDLDFLEYLPDPAYLSWREKQMFKQDSKICLNFTSNWTF